MIKLIVITLFLIPFTSYSQSYLIDTLRREYIELDSFNSIAKESLGNKTWSKKFELPFSFPYYDSIYTQIICDYESKCYFEFNPNWDIGLMTFGYQFDNVLDTTNIMSDVRYKVIRHDEKQVLVLQFTKNRLISDQSISQFDSYINYQLRFYETGEIEVHFGDINLDNSPNYRPGEGFYLITQSGQEINFGPEMGIRHPFDEDDQTFLDGDWNDFYVDNGSGFLTTLPPKGFVIKFSNKGTNTNDLHEITSKIFPNPTSSFVNIQSHSEIKMVRIKDLNNQIVISFKTNLNSHNISHIPSGIYVMELFVGTKIEYLKFIKI